MTIKTLFEDVCALGFEDATDMTDAFIYSAKRAQRTIALEWGREARARILASGIDTVSTVKLLKKAPSDTVSYNSGAANAFSFKVSGKGSYKIIDSSGEEKYSFDSVMALHRGFMSRGGLLVFLSGRYVVSDIAFFNLPADSKTEDIPVYYDECEYDLPDYVKDFLAATSAPTDHNGERIEGAKILGDVLSLPSSYIGEVNVYYKRLPKEISPYSNEDIDVPKVAEHLLPLLTAAYFWLEDSPEKSQYYMQLYRDETSRTRRYLPSTVGGEYRDVTGWAK